MVSKGLKNYTTKIRGKKKKTRVLNYGKEKEA